MRKSKEFTEGEPLLPGDTSRKRGGKKEGRRGDYRRGDRLPPSFESRGFTEKQLNTFKMVLMALQMDAEREKLLLEAQLKQIMENEEQLRHILSHSHDIDIVIEPDEGGFHAYCPALKGLHTSGETVEEAKAHAQDAVIAYLQSIIKHGDPIPEGICRS